MTGLLLLLLAIGWFFFCVKAANWVAGRIKNRSAFLTVSPLVFAIFAILPVADEVLGKWQFEDLCRKYAIQIIDEQRAKNRRVVYEPRGPDRFAKGTVLRIRIDPVVYRDLETNDVLVSYHTLQARGGWLIRLIGISPTDAPLLFNSACYPADQDAFKEKLNITVVN